MHFKKDILLIDLETTGLDAAKQEIIQLAAILLDKKNLKEKKVFASYVKPKKWRQRNLESMQVNKITLADLADAPDLKKVIGEFETEFGTDVILAYYGGPVDMDFLREAYKKIKKPFRFDYHYFNLWPVFFAYLASKNQLDNSKKFTGFSLDDFMKKFKIKSKARHDALEDCRVEAEILRRIMSKAW